MEHYILVDNIPRFCECNDLTHFQAVQLFRTKGKNAEVSTVFLPFAHGYVDNHPARPILFESIVFGKDNAEKLLRTTSYEKACKNHKELVKESIRPEEIISVKIHKTEQKKEEKTDRWDMILQ